MKRIRYLIYWISLCVSVSVNSYAETGSFSIGGDVDKFYPVVFSDGGWTSNEPTVLKIGRSNVHTDATWRGSVIAEFTFHVTNWGNASNFINAHIEENISFVAGWHDATSSNGSFKIIIWLKGGSTTYSFNASHWTAPAVYDGVQNALPYQETNGPSHSYKTTVDDYVNESGSSFDHPAFFNGTGTSVIKGKLGIGTKITGDYKLAVEGTIGARKMKVTQAAWADYVFEDDYKLTPLKEVEFFIKKYKHLPDVPSAKEIQKNGIDLGDSQALLLKKIEELTLYVIQLEKDLNTLKNKQDSER